MDSKNCSSRNKKRWGKKLRFSYLISAVILVLIFLIFFISGCVRDTVKVEQTAQPTESPKYSLEPTNSPEIDQPENEKQMDGLW